MAIVTAGNQTLTFPIGHVEGNSRRRTVQTEVQVRTTQSREQHNGAQHYE